MTYKVNAWKTVKGFPQYKVSPAGEVIRLAGVVTCKNGVKKRIKENILTPSMDRYGYLQIILNSSPVKKRFFIHRLVALCFIGESEMQVNHIDGDKKNNNVSNLEYVTCKENIQHSIDTGLRCNKGANNPAAKLNNENIKAIRQMNEEGYSRKEIAQKYSISTGHLSNILRGHNWK